MKTLNLEEMENVSGGGDWCDGINMLIASGFDFGSVDSGSYVGALYAEHCAPQQQ